MSKPKIQIITREELGNMIGITKQAVSKAVNVSKKLRDTKHDGQKGINLHDPMTAQYVAEICSKKNIPLPGIFKKEKSDVQLFMEAVDYAYDKYMCEDCRDIKPDFQAAVIEYVRSEKS